eukprot:GHVH01011651.1.p1 GENE.GHVH01011651.1~~GHVH01011651.1.p1  ORF type:complete len:384 (-),score=65.74 GHVH01011651.1:340-1428(-)
MDPSIIGTHTPVAKMSGEYFDSYDDCEVHRVMLSDLRRMDAFYEAIQAVDMQGLVVMDVGGGSGILSLMAAKRGAKRVYCVEASGMASRARRAVDQNGLADVVKVIQKRVEDVDAEDFVPEDLLRAAPSLRVVDIVLSEWMGFHLYHENMLPSVIAARDKFVIPHAVSASGEPSLCRWQMMPSECSLSLAVADLTHEHYERHGLMAEISNRFDLDYRGILGTGAEEPASGEPEIIQLHNDDCIDFCTGGDRFHVLDLCTAPLNFMEEVSGSVNLILSPSEDRSAHGFVIWWSCTFHCPSGSVSSVLSTRPGVRTHWKQTVIWLPSLQLQGGDTTELSVAIRLGPSEENERHVKIDLDVIDVK